MDVFESSLQAVPGIPQLLRGLRGSRCVASSSPLPRVQRSLELTGLLEFFEAHLFSAAMVEHDKPAPDLFLHAAAEMDVTPEHCVVIEDRPYGVAAGRAAEMMVVGFTGGSHCTPEYSSTLRRAGAHHLAADARELGRVLDQISGAK